MQNTVSHISGRSAHSFWRRIRCDSADSKGTVETHGWVTEEDVLNIIAVAESTPGPIAINSATLLGIKLPDSGEAFCATLGVVLSLLFIVISILSFFLEPF